MAGYDASKDVVLFSGTPLAVGKARYRIMVYKYDTKGQPKLAVETEFLKADGSTSWRLHQSRIPGPVVVEMYKSIVDLLQVIDPSALPSNPPQVEDEDEDDEEAEEAVSSVMNNVAQKPAKKLKLTGVKAK